jgi:hypothetical protein
MEHSIKPGFLLLLFSVFFLVNTCDMAKYQAESYDAAPMIKRTAAFGASVQFEAVESASDSSGLDMPPMGEEAAGQTRKLTKRAELRLKVEDPAATEKPLTELMEKYGAWPASSGIYENSRNYSIRVPLASYGDMLSELAGLGKIIRRTEYAEDVTLRYYDLESRLATKRELLKTYQGYLGKASNIDEIMSVESRIADLQQEIDWTGTQFRNLANLIDYSTIDVEISGPVSSSSYSKPTLGEKLRELFGSFGDVASSALVVLLAIVIYGIPAVFFVVLLFWVFFGRIGLLKKLWRLAAEKKDAPRQRDKPGAESAMEL